MKYLMSFLTISIIYYLCSYKLIVDNKNAKEYVFHNANTQSDYHLTLRLFLKSEKKLIEHRKFIFNNRIKSDPITEYEYWLKIFKKYSPELLQNTKFYSKDLVKMLYDKQLIKDKFFDQDIIMLLYNLCITDYTNLIEDIHSLYKQKKINISVLIMTVDQDNTFNNQISKMYYNENLKRILTKIYNDQSINNKEFKNRINDILSGAVWKKEAYELSKYQPPILHTNCNN